MTKTPQLNLPDYISKIAGAILLMVGALLPVVIPLGDAPIFLAMTPGCDELTRADLAKRIAIYSFFLLLGAMLLGSFVLLMFGLSIPVVQVAGGAVVCALGWKLFSPTIPNRPTQLWTRFTRMPSRWDARLLR